MKINKIHDFLEKPQLYDKGTAVMWEDPYIQKKLLKAHLDPSIDVASRNIKDIEKTLKWLSKSFDKKEMLIIDLGCGPGLYAERLAKLGHQVIGVDVNNYSLDYALGNASNKGLSIDYVHSNYLDYTFPQGVDLVLLIFCDFGVLSEKEHTHLLTKIKNSLSPDGAFIFDAYNPHFINTLDLTRKTEVSLSGFWRDHPYLALSEGYLYPDHHAFLEQHIVVDDDVACYRFYNHAWEEHVVCAKLKQHGFHHVTAHHDVIDNETISFYMAKLASKER